MATHRSDKDSAREIQDTIARVLREDWNPIGLAGLPADEYDGYVGGVYRLLAENATPDRVAAHLARVETESTGLPHRDPAGLLPVARKLSALDVRVRPSRPAI